MMKAIEACVYFMAIGYIVWMFLVFTGLLFLMVEDEYEGIAFGISLFVPMIPLGFFFIVEKLFSKRNSMHLDRPLDMVDHELNERGVEPDKREDYGDSHPICSSCGRPAIRYDIVERRWTCLNCMNKPHFAGY